MNLWTKAAIALALIWGTAFGVIHLARSSKPTAASVEKALQSAALGGKSQDERARRIDKVAAQMNRLPLEDRQHLRRSPASDDFFKALTPEEQLRFLDATLPTGFKQMMDSFNKMDRKKRKEIVERALADLRKDEGDGAVPPPALDDKNLQRIVDQGLRSFYNDSNAEVKADLSPLIEQLQRTLQRTGR